MKAKKLGPLGTPVSKATSDFVVKKGPAWRFFEDETKILHRVLSGAERLLYQLGVKYPEVEQGISHPIFRDHPHRHSCQVLYAFGSPNFISKLQDHVIALSRTERDVQKQRPVLCMTFHKGNRRKQVWVYQNSIYEASPLLKPSDAKSLIMLSAIEDKEKLERLKTLSTALRSYKRNDRSPQKRGIPSEVQSLVWIRDAGKCCKCGRSEDLQYDHIIPVEKGGGNTEKNIQLLCGICNRRKSNNIGC